MSSAAMQGTIYIMLEADRRRCGYLPTTHPSWTGQQQLDSQVFPTPPSRVSVASPLLPRRVCYPPTHQSECDSPDLSVGMYGGFPRGNGFNQTDSSLSDTSLTYPPECDPPDLSVGMYTGFLQGNGFSQTDSSLSDTSLTYQPGCDSPDLRVGIYTGFLQGNGFSQTDSSLSDTSLTYPPECDSPDLSVCTYPGLLLGNDFSQTDSSLSDTSLTYPPECDSPDLSVGMYAGFLHGNGFCQTGSSLSETSLTYSGSDDSLGDKTRNWLARARMAIGPPVLPQPETDPGTFGLFRTETPIRTTAISPVAGGMSIFTHSSLSTSHDCLGLERDFHPMQVQASRPSSPPATGLDFHECVNPMLDPASTLAAHHCNGPRATDPAWALSQCTHRAEEGDGERVRCRVHGIERRRRPKAVKRRHFTCPLCTAVLVVAFKKRRNPSALEKEELLRKVGMERHQLDNWFCNMRRKLQAKLEGASPSTPLGEECCN